MLFTSSQIALLPDIAARAADIVQFLAMLLECTRCPGVNRDIPFLFPLYAVAIGRIHFLVRHKMDTACSIEVAIVIHDDRQYVSVKS